MFTLLKKALKTSAAYLFLIYWVYWTKSNKLDMMRLSDAFIPANTLICEVDLI